jgi:hypothetical protein
MPDQPSSGPRPTDERLADPDVESLLDEDAAVVEVPNDERVVPEDVNEYVPEDHDYGHED